MSPDEPLDERRTADVPATTNGVPRWTVVVPVKRAAEAKSRLAPFAGGYRGELARAMALDTVTAALRCPSVLEVVAVTDDPDSGRALRDLGALVVPDEPDAGLNPALAHGAATARDRRRDAAVAAMSADLPALRPEELAVALTAAALHPTSFVADSAFEGTTLYCAAAGSVFAPKFGAGSRAAHRSSGVVEIHVAGIASVRRDVDTEADLRAAVRLGVGERTRIVLDALEPSRQPNP